MATRRPQPESVPPRPLMVPPFRGGVNALCVEPLDISGPCEDVLACGGIGPGRLAAALATSAERPDVLLRRMSARL